MSFVTEGINLFREAPPERIVAVCATAKFTRENPELIGMIPPAAERILDIREERFAGISDTKNPQGILTVQRKPEFDLDEILMRESPLFLVLENIQDPGNAGTILRTAEAAGVHAVFLTQGAVDLYNPKTIRSTMGAIYRVPHFYVDDMDALLARFAERFLHGSRRERSGPLRPISAERMPTRSSTSAAERHFLSEMKAAASLTPSRTAWMF